jgi:hypothetical protein
VFCPECWSNKKSILLRHILTSAAARLEFVTTRNYVENLWLWDMMLTLGSDDCFVAKDKHFFILIWMLTTVVHLCSIHRHKTVWCSLVLAVKASLREYERGQLCCVMTSGKYIYFKTNHNKVLSDSEFDTENGHSCFQLQSVLRLACKHLSVLHIHI